MTQALPKSLIILSQKSSGSSILQKELNAHPDIRHATQTGHAENETLYWYKAACYLELPQALFFKGSVRYSKDQAYAELLKLIKANCPDFDAQGLEGEAFIDAGWSALAQSFGSIFLEKSPRHLQHRAALVAMLESFERQNANFLLIGLIRHPMAVLYSMWDRWGSKPNYKQAVWMEAAHNLRWLRENVDSQKLIITRYEDMIAQPEALMKDITQRLGLTYKDEMGRNMHRKSAEKWKGQYVKIRSFLGFALETRSFEEFTDLSEETKQTARLWGYEV